MRRSQVLTFTALLLTYCGFLLALYLIPHRMDGSGRMVWHQYYAYVGQALSFGCLDYVFVDWYYIGETWAETTEHYDYWVLRSVRHQTPVWLAWMTAISWSVGRLANRLRATPS